MFSFSIQFSSYLYQPATSIMVFTLFLLDFLARHFLQLSHQITLLSRNSLYHSIFTYAISTFKFLKLIIAISPHMIWRENSPFSPHIPHLIFHNIPINVYLLYSQHKSARILHTYLVLYRRKLCTKPPCSVLYLVGIYNIKKRIYTTIVIYYFIHTFTHISFPNLFSHSFHFLALYIFS